jgi:hypothetical protein
MLGRNGNYKIYFYRIFADYKMLSKPAVWAKYDGIYL